MGKLPVIKEHVRIKIYYKIGSMINSSFMPFILICETKYLQLIKHPSLGKEAKLIAKYLAVHDYHANV